MLTVVVDRRECVVDVRQGGVSVPFSVQVASSSTPFTAITDGRGRFLDLIQSGRTQKIGYTVETADRAHDTDLVDLSTESHCDANTTAADYQCSWCGESRPTLESFVQCRRCKTALYCNRLCSSGHWTQGNHARECCPPPH